MQNSPIGVFDSGIGGLTVVKEIIRVLPDENLIYLGDTARVPYGTRSKEVVKKFALELVSFLLEKEVKALVVACNTISSIALEEIHKITDIPIIDVIDPTIKQAVKLTTKPLIGVIGTKATVQSRAYHTGIKKLNNSLDVIAQACPLFIPLVESGYSNHPATKLIAKEYLANFNETQIDTLILGCTHFPLLTSVIQDIVGSKIKLIDSAKPTAHELKLVLENLKLLNTDSSPQYKFFVTDTPEQSLDVANLFFDNKLPGRIEQTTL